MLWFINVINNKNHVFFPKYENRRKHFKLLSFMKNFGFLVLVALMLSGVVGNAQSSGTYKITIDTKLDGQVTNELETNFDITIQNGLLNGIDNNNRTIKGLIYSDNSGDKIITFYWSDGGTKAGFAGRYDGVRIIGSWTNNSRLSGDFKLIKQ